MKNAQTYKTIALVLALSVGTTFAKEDGDEKVAFSSLPEAVQKTIQAEAVKKTATVGEVEKENEEGKTAYEAKIVQKDGKKFEVSVAEDGTLLKVKEDDDDKEKKGDKDEDDEAK